MKQRAKLRAKWWEGRQGDSEKGLGEYECVHAGTLTRKQDTARKQGVRRSLELESLDWS